VAAVSDAPDVIPRSSDELLELLGQLVGEVRRGELDPKRGNCVGYLVSIAVRVLQGAAMEERVRQLDARLAAAAQANGHANGYHAAGRN
jgi:hypothetical protein